MKRINALFFMLILTMLMPVQAEEAPVVRDFSATIDLFKSSEQVQPFFKHAYAYAVFPTVGKGGFVFAGAHGKGQVYRYGKVAGLTSMTQVTVGLQIGGQAFSQILFFEDERAYNEFTSGNFELSAGASAVAITAGAQAGATTGSGGTTSASSGAPGDLQGGYYKGVAVFVHTKGGFMLEAAVGGQKFTFTPLD
jgi:lipid-binding SYLF domain-containing protein